jgi:hypothetical protein
LTVHFCQDLILISAQTRETGSGLSECPEDGRLFENKEIKAAIQKKIIPEIRGCQ